MMAYTIGREDENEQRRSRNVKQRIYDWHATPHPTNSEVKGITSYPAMSRTLRRVWQTVSRRARKKLDRSAGLDPEAVKALESLDLKDATIAQMMQGFLETGLWPQNVTKREREKLGRVVYLMYVRESVRDPENVALAPMTIDLIARGQMTFHEAFAEFEGDDGTVESRTRTGGRGRYPASMEGAAPAARGLVAEDRNERLRVSEHGREETRRELEWRKVDLVTRWLEARLRSRGEAWGGTRADVVEFIRKFIVEHHGLVE
jgi:hypothetical protein